MKKKLNQLLKSACEELSMTLNETQIEQLLTYTQELEKWNKTYNLTAIRDAESMMKRHVIDALSVMTAVKNYSPKTLADIGTGGGVPGVILAIVFPDLQVYLVESIGKKCRFLRHVVAELGLQSRVEVVQQRVEDWSLEVPLSIVVCRAFTSLANFTTITRHLGDEQTVWLAMKAENTDEEIERLPNDFVMTKDITLTVPYEVAERHLLVLKKDK